jgi:hypothetical protein
MTSTTLTLFDKLPLHVIQSLIDIIIKNIVALNLIYQIDNIAEKTNFDEIKCWEQTLDNFCKAHPRTQLIINKIRCEFSPSQIVSIKYNVPKIIHHNTYCASYMCDKYSSSSFSNENTCECDVDKQWVSHCGIKVCSKHCRTLLKNVDFRCSKCDFSHEDDNIMCFVGFTSDSYGMRVYEDHRKNITFILKCTKCKGICKPIIAD